MEGLLEYLREYWDKNNLKDVVGANRYKIKEVGAHYIIDHIELESSEKEELKKVVSQRACLEQALAVSMIPTKYLGQVLPGLPKEAQNIDLVKQHTKLAEIVLEKIPPEDYSNPRPFDLNDDGPYTFVRQRGIRMIVDLAFQITGEPIAKILNTGERTNTFNQAAGIIVQYLDNHPTLMGVSRQ